MLIEGTSHGLCEASRRQFEPVMILFVNSASLCHFSTGTFSSGRLNSLSCIVYCNWFAQPRLFRVTCMYFMYGSKSLSLQRNTRRVFIFIKFEEAIEIYIALFLKILILQITLVKCRRRKKNRRETVTWVSL